MRAAPPMEGVMRSMPAPNDDGYLEALDAGLTQADLAELVGVSRKTINTVENGVILDLKKQD